MAVDRGKGNRKRSETPSEGIGKASHGWSFAPGILSLLIALHLAGIVAEPLRFFSRSPVLEGAPYALSLRRWMAPYVEFFYWDHGYFFFAPNPGPNHLLEATRSDSDRTSSSRRWPDRQRHWPRLDYHRHFMLAEFYHGLAVAPQPDPQEAQRPDLLARWEADRQRFLAIDRSIRRHLDQQLEGSLYRLDRIEHPLPDPDQFFGERLRLDDPKSYQVLPDALGPAATLGAPGSLSSPVMGEQKDE